MILALKRENEADFVTKKAKNATETQQENWNRYKNVTPKSAFERIKLRFCYKKHRKIRKNGPERVDETFKV